MPNPLDYLKKAFSAATSSVIPQHYTDDAANAIDEPELERGPWEARARGFGAGALQGAADQINPLNIIASLVPGYRALRGAYGGAKALQGAAGAGRAAGAIESAAAPTMDVIESVPVKQIMPAMDDVESLLGDMSRNLAKIRPKPAAPASTAGMRVAELAPVGEEAAYNAANQIPKAAGYGDGLYAQLMRQRFGGTAR